MIHDFDCTTLTGRERQICEGTSGLPETGPGNTRESYIHFFISRRDGKLPPQPTLIQKAWNLMGFLVDFVSDGCELVDATEYKKRLEICHPCERRDGDSCGGCGCNLSLKAKARAAECPLGKWPK